MIANASRGEFLVKLQTTHGTRSYRVNVDLHPNELAWWDTTTAMHHTPSTQAADRDTDAFTVESS